MVDINFSNDQVDLLIDTNVEAIMAGIGPQHDNTEDAPQAQIYKALRALSAETLKNRFTDFESDYRSGLQLMLDEHSVVWQFVDIDVAETGDIRLARQSTIHYRSPMPGHVVEARWSYAARFGDAVVHFITQGGERQSYWLVSGESSPPYRLGKPLQDQQGLAVFSQYFPLGFVHILPGGMDHILFVLGLFLLSRRLGILLWQVTAFTLAHSLTLALGLYGVVTPSAALIEPLIALSIAWVGVENLLAMRRQKPMLSRRVPVVFLFGLLHGLGFAEVLLQLGLPPQSFITALMAFNLGVEAGQIAVIVIAWLVFYPLSRRADHYRQSVVVPGSLVIIMMGLYWMIERLMLLF